MPLQIRIADEPTPPEYSNTFVLRVYSTHGPHFTDSTDHPFTALDPLIEETLKVLDHVDEQEFCDDSVFEEMYSLFSEASVELAITLIGGDITTDGEMMASLEAYEIVWINEQGQEFDTELEITE